MKPPPEPENRKLKQRNEAFQSIKAFLPNDKIITTIIDICDLYPIEKSWRKWTDHLGNFLQVRNRRIISFSQDPSKNDKIITDIYFKATPERLSKISSWVFISFGKDQTNSFNTFKIHNKLY